MESGHRVTITYNLYFADHEPEVTPAPPPVDPGSPSSLEHLADPIKALLVDPNFLPKGGLIGFGLKHQYPLSDGTHPASLEAFLKGGDRVIMNAVRQHDLSASLYILYECKPHDIEAICTTRLGPGDDQVEALDRVLESDYGGILLQTRDQIYSRWYPREYEGVEIERGPDVAWITPKTTANSVEDLYLAYGNEASISYAYGTMVLMVKVGGIADRFDISMFDKRDEPMSHRYRRQYLIHLIKPIGTVFVPYKSKWSFRA